MAWIFFVAGGVSFAGIVVGIFVLCFYCGMRQHRTWDALENDVAEAIVEAEEGRRGARAESWRNQEHPDPWVAEVLRRNEGWGGGEEGKHRLERSGSGRHDEVKSERS